MSHADVLGWAAAALMVSTFAARDARVMRPLAIATNVAFIGYGLAGALPPVIALHALLLPINLWHWVQCLGPRGKAMPSSLLRVLVRSLWMAALVLAAGCGSLLGGGGMRVQP
jgi:hypothetical protein